MDRHPKQPSDVVFDRYWPTSENRKCYEHAAVASGLRHQAQSSVNGFLLLALARLEALLQALQRGTSDVGVQQRVVALESRVEALEALRAQHAKDRDTALAKAREARWPKSAAVPPPPSAEAPPCP